jgi:hypothetical protein
MKQVVERNNIKNRMADVHENNERFFVFSPQARHLNTGPKPQQPPSPGANAVRGEDVLEKHSQRIEQRRHDRLNKIKTDKKQHAIINKIFKNKKEIKKFHKIKVVQHDESQPTAHKRHSLKKAAEGVLMLLSALAISSVLFIFGYSEMPKISAFLLGGSNYGQDGTPKDNNSRAEDKTKNPAIVVSRDSSDIFKQDLILGALGYDTPKNYLLVLQNGFVPRPAGGFTAAYLYFSVNKGEVAKVSSGNFYDIDQGLKNKLNPPEQLSLYSNIWGANSANWFADFPVSAKKTIDFFEESTDLKTDFLIMADMRSLFTDILKQPENKIMQMTPADIKSSLELLAKEFPSPKKMLVEKSDYFTDLAQKRKIMIYAADQKTEEKILREGFGGSMDLKPAKDHYFASPVSLDPSPRYLMNAQIISDNIRINVNKEAVHELKFDYDLSKNPNQKKYGKDTYYLKLYLPKGAELRSASGFFSPKLPAKDPSFRDDPLVSSAASTVIKDALTGLEVYEEGDLTVIGGYFQVSSKKARVAISYSISNVFIRPPSEYDLTVVAHPGIKTVLRVNFGSEEGLEFRPISEDIVGSIFAGTIEGKKRFSLGVEEIQPEVVADPEQPEELLPPEGTAQPATND